MGSSPLFLIALMSGLAGMAVYEKVWEPDGQDMILDFFGRLFVGGFLFGAAIFIALLVVTGSALYTTGG